MFICCAFIFGTREFEELRSNILPPPPPCAYTHLQHIHMLLLHACTLHTYNVGNAPSDTSLLRQVGLLKDMYLRKDVNRMKIIYLFDSINLAAPFLPAQFFFFIVLFVLFWLWLLRDNNDKQWICLQ